MVGGARVFILIAWHNDELSFPDSLADDVAQRLKVDLSIGLRCPGKHTARIH